MIEPNELLQRALALRPQIVERRRLLHSQPELSFQEVNTAEAASLWLEEIGFTVKRGIAGTGVIAEHGTGKTVAIRSDMDALPGFEANRSNYVSRIPGAMHACGHDAHLAIVIAAAKLVKEAKTEGCIRIILQPGTEEAEKDGNNGARMMLEQGALEDVSALLGLHVDATIETGTVGILSTPLNSLLCGYSLSISAESLQANKAADALPFTNKLVTAIYKLSQELSSGAEPVGISIGSVNSSSQRGNILSQEALIAGTISSANQAGLTRGQEGLTRTINTLKTEGISVTLETREIASMSSQSAAVTEILRTAAITLIGENRVSAVNRKTWASDFAMLANKAPAAFLYLGCQIAGSRRIHHHPSFDLDESGLHLGAGLLALTALQLLEQ